MAIAITALTNGTGNTNTDAASYATGTISDAPSNTLLLARIAYTHGETTANIPTCSGLGLTWEQVEEISLVSTSIWRIVLFRAVGTPVSGTVTFDFAGQNQQSAAWAVYSVSDAATGTNGADAVVQSNSVAESDPSVPLNAFADNVNNACFFCGETALNTLATAEGALITLTSGSQGTANMGWIDAWLLGEDTSPSFSSSGGGLALAIEIDQGLAANPSAAGQYYRRLMG